MNEPPLRFDLHVHTCYSRDCTTTFEEIISSSRKSGLRGAAITDHDTVEGALRLLEKKTGLMIIPGVEISTVQGHILGINVTSSISPHLSVEETIRKIHEAGGIAVATHPSAIFKDGIGLSAKIASYGLDAVEVINSSNFPFSFLNDLNIRLAERLGLPQTAGSDSHLPETIGLAYTTIRDVHTDPEVEDIVQAVKEGMIVPFGKPIPWRSRFRKIMQRKKVEKIQLNFKAGTSQDL